MKHFRSGYLYILLSAVIFSTMEVVLKTVQGVFAPMQITCLRFLIGGVLLLPFALRSMKRKQTVLTKSDFGYFALVGFLCVAFAMALYQMVFLTYRSVFTPDDIVYFDLVFLTISFNLVF